MKKTLITAALAFGMASITSAATLLDAQYSLTKSTASTSLSDVTSSFTVTTTITGSTFAAVAPGESAIMDNTFTLLSVSSSTYTVGISTGYSSSGGIITSSGLFASHGTIASTTNNAGTYGSYASDSTNTVDGKSITNILATLDLTDVKGMALTMVHENGVKTSAYFTVSYNSGDEVTYYGSATGIKWTSNGAGAFGTPSTLNLNTNEVTSAYVFSGALSQEDAIAINKEAIAASIPEPATASLSLLGLAALMMRRRRA